jgi:microcystin-dependent protein
MTTPFIGEIRIVSFNFAPKGWALCNGQLLPINQNQALFSILGTTYGGNGQTNFALPNFQGRAPMHFGNGFTLGQISGEENHTLIITEMATHNHLVSASSAAPDVGTMANNSWAANPGAYGSTVTTTMNPASIGNAGGSQPHNNMQPYLVLNFVIALQGIFPSRN